MCARLEIRTGRLASRRARAVRAKCSLAGLTRISTDHATCASPVMGYCLRRLTTYLHRLAAREARLPCAHGPSRAASSMLPIRELCEGSERADNQLDKRRTCRTCFSSKFARLRGAAPLYVSLRSTKAAKPDVSRQEQLRSPNQVLTHAARAATKQLKAEVPTTRSARFAAVGKTTFGKILPYHLRCDQNMI